MPVSVLATRNAMLSFLPANRIESAIPMKAFDRNPISRIVAVAIAAFFSFGLGAAEATIQKTSPKTAPRLPWHMADIWWTFEKPTPHFESLEVDVTIDRDVPDTVNLYVSPCGIAQINGLDFYGGLQSNINGWANATNRTRVHPGKGAIFSRWSSDKKTPVSLENVRIAGPDCLIESAGYEGQFGSVRRPFAWTKGTYTYQVSKGASEITNGQTNTWFTCRVKDSEGKEFEVGSLRFEGSDFTFWARHSAFVEIYATTKIPRSAVPEVKVTFGYPRLNGRPPALKSARVVHPGPGEQSASPDVAKAAADGSNIVVTIGPEFERTAAERKHPLDLKAP